MKACAHTFSDILYRGSGQQKFKGGFMPSHFIDGQWIEGNGPSFSSVNPATSQKVWEGHEASASEVQASINAAKTAFKNWSKFSTSERIHFLEKYRKSLTESTESLTIAISKETGKPLWESQNEVAAMIAKIDISIQAYSLRCPDTSHDLPQGPVHVRHRPHGVMAVLGPFNFPGHLPNGHIIPALLAGNTIVFKPSERTPLVAEISMKCWEKAGLPQGVINMIQGGRNTGQQLSQNPAIDGLLFVGSWPTGRHLAKQLAETPYKILALEMGGNNPLIIGEITDLKIAAYLTIQSAFLTSGQRCTCARRLIIPKTKLGDEFLSVLEEMTKKIHIGSYDEIPQPFMGPVISQEAATHLLTKQQDFLSRGARSILSLKRLEKGPAFVSPGIIDVTDISHRADEEIFGPLLQVIRVSNFDEAIDEANHTQYGLAAGLLSDNKAQYNRFYEQIHAGNISWNAPTTGTSSTVPFGGLGHSGNLRPSGFYAADYCAHPVSSVENPSLKMPKNISPGIN